jgi:hypothetical protein
LVRLSRSDLKVWDGEPSIVIDRQAAAVDERSKQETIALELELPLLVEGAPRNAPSVVSGEHLSRLVNPLLMFIESRELRAGGGGDPQGADDDEGGRPPHTGLGTAMLQMAARGNRLAVPPVPASSRSNHCAASDV